MATIAPATPLAGTVGKRLNVVLFPLKRILLPLSVFLRLTSGLKKEVKVLEGFFDAFAGTGAQSEAKLLEDHRYTTAHLPHSITDFSKTYRLQYGQVQIKSTSASAPQKVKLHASLNSHTS